jgi:predicted proteasome-type protease
MSVLSQLGRVFLLATLGFIQCNDAIHDAIVENPPLISDPELERSLMAVARMHNATTLLQGTTKRMDERDVRYMFEVSQHKPRFATRKEFTKSLTPGQKFEILGAHI